MKPGSIVENAIEMEEIMSVCCGMPKGDELPQVAGVQDILMDVYSDMLNMPREYAAGCMLHQNDESLDFEDRIH